MSIKLYNTATRSLEEFEPISPTEVRMYHCGPTVYGTQHIGNLSMFVFIDVLRRSLEYKGMDVMQVINFTDFGHLSSDADEGEDKMAKGLKRERLEPTLENMHKLGIKYAEIFLDDLAQLNVRREGTLFPYASEYVEEQVDLVKKLEDKGFTYATSDGLYFDTEKFPGYGKLGGLSGTDAQARVAENSQKRGPKDFALWKFNKELGWPSPWGQGFPGWHIECSAMIIELLGEQIDIHTGGIEHIPVHHNNEIAQSEAATGKAPFSRYWLHRAHLQVDGGKIAKSEGNTVYLSDIVEKGMSPLAFRYFLMLSHYRTSTNFTWEALEAAENAYKKLKEFFVKNNEPDSVKATTGRQGTISKEYLMQFEAAIDDDLNTPEALAVVWKLVKDETVSPGDKRATLLDFDQVLGLDLENNEYEVVSIPDEVQDLLNKREKARIDGNYAESDELRDLIASHGYTVKDTESGPKLSRSNN